MLLYIKKAVQTNLNSFQTSFTIYNHINNNYQPFYRNLTKFVSSLNFMAKENDWE